MTTNPINNSLSDSYTRFSGPTVTLSSLGGGPKIKSKKQSALERYEAERAVREAEEEEKIGKDPAYAAAKKARDILGKNELAVLNQLEKAKDQRNRQSMTRFNAMGGGSERDYERFKNFEDVQAGTPRGKFLMMQRATQLDVNDPEYKDIQQRLSTRTQQNNPFY